MESEFETKNFYFKYKYINYDIQLDLNMELFRCKLYKLFIQYHIDLCKESNFKINKKDNRKNENILTEILSMFIFFKEDTDDVFFSKNPKYKMDYILQYIIRYTKKIDIYKQILKKMETESIKFFYILKKNKTDSNIKYRIISDVQNNNFLLIKCINESSNNIYSSYIIKYPLYSHLFNLFIHNNKVDLKFDNISIENFLQKYFSEHSKIDENTKNIMDNINKYIFILFNRYNCIHSGGNQASILPSFKFFIKKYLNIKVELFGSALNTSCYTYGSIFYDIEKYFGSKGSFFNMDIIRGYYELNPPFVFSVIYNMFKKLYLSLEKSKEGLLFVIIIPKSKLDDFKYYNLLDKYLKYQNILDKNIFPYIQYDINYTNQKIRYIVNTYILIYHNEYINEITKNIVSSFNEYLDKYINSIKK